MWEVNYNKIIPELSVNNFDKSMEFYIELLGFEINYSMSTS